MKMCFITLRMDKLETVLPGKYRRETPFYLWDHNICTSKYISQTRKTEYPCILPFELKQLLPIGRSMHPDHQAEKDLRAKIKLLYKEVRKDNICIITNVLKLSTTQLIGQ